MNNQTTFLKKARIQNLAFRIKIFSALAFLITSQIEINPLIAKQQEYDGQIRRSFTEPIKKSVVSCTETGVVDKILTEEGDYVRGDQLLGELDNQILKQSLRMAQARVNSTARAEAARLRMRMMEQRKNTLESLVREGHANPFEVEQTKSEYETTVADFRALEEEQTLNEIEVDRIQAQINQRQIRSPLDGFVIRIHRQRGELIANASPEFVTLVKIDQLKIRFYLDARWLEKLKAGAEVDVLVGVEKQKKRAKVKFVSPIIDPDSGTGRVDVVIENSDHRIRSGTVCFWPNQKIQSSMEAKRDENKIGLKR